MRNPQTLAYILTVLFCPILLMGQNRATSIEFSNLQCQTLLEKYSHQYNAVGATDAQKQEALRFFEQIFDFRTQPGCVANLILASDVALAHAHLLQGFATLAEKQLSSSVSTSGSTALVAKNFSSELLSIANEYGALTSSKSGQTTTIGGSLDQFLVALESNAKGVFTECAVQVVPRSPCVNSGLMEVLGRVSYSASLDLTQPSTISGTATGPASGGAQQVTGNQTGNGFGLSQFTAKIFVWGAKPTKAQLVSAISSALNTSIQTDNKHLIALRQVQQTAGEGNGQAWKSWLEAATKSLITDTSPSQLASQTSALIQTLTTAGGVSESDLVQDCLNFASSLASVASAERLAYDSAAWSKPIVSFEYDYNTPSNQPTNSVFRLIWGQSLKAWKLTANIAGSIYNSTPSSAIPQAERFRDFQAGAEADYTLPKFSQLDSSMFSAAYYYQDQTSPSILNVNPSNPVPGVSFTGLSGTATQVFTQRGPINVAQLKLTLGSSSVGVKFPISVSWSNRTELINKAETRGQVGIAFDLDSLLK